MKKRRWLTSILAGVILLLFVAVLTAGASVEGQRSLGSKAVCSGGPIGYRFPISHYEDGDSYEPAVAYNPDRGEYLVAWANQGSTSNDIQAQRVTASGQPAGEPFFVAAGAGVQRWSPAIAYNSHRGEYLVVWGLWTGTKNELHAQPVAAEGGVSGADVTLATGPSGLCPPAVAYSPVSDNYLVASDVSGGGISEILVQVLKSDGTTGGGPYSIRVVTWPDSLGCFDLAYNRSRNEFLVVWDETPSGGNSDIYGRRVQGNGTPMHPEKIAITALSGDQQWPAVAGLPTEPDRGQYLVVWTEELGGPNTGEIWARRVAGEGNPEGGSFWITDDPDHERSADVAASEHDHQYLVVGGRYVQAGPDSTWVVLGRKVSLGGELLGSEAWLEGNIVFGTSLANGPRSDFLIAFDDQLPTSYAGIWGHLWGNHRVHLPQVLR